MTPPLPPSALLAWWATSWLRGHTVTDLVLESVAADGRLHQGPDGTSLAPVLGLLRASGASGCGLALPVPGDPLGLGGPAALNELALDHGEAVVCSEAGIGLVPELGDEVVTWHVVEAAVRQLPDVGEADRELRAATLHAAEALVALDVARWRPEVADLFLEAGTPRPTPAPPGTPSRCVSLADRASTASQIVELALDDDGGAVSAGDARERREALLPLDRAARRGLVAACSAEVWPPEARPPMAQTSAG